MQINAVHVLEGAVAFALVEGAAYITGGVPSVIANVPIAVGVFYMGCRNGVSLTQLQSEFSSLVTAFDKSSQQATPQPQSSTSTPKVSAPVVTAATISYSIDGHQINVQTNAPMGTQETFADSNTYTVGQQTTSQITLKDGQVIPKGAVFIGQGEFEYNGNYFGN